MECINNKLRKCIFNWLNQMFSQKLKNKTKSQIFRTDPLLYGPIGLFYNIHTGLDICVLLSNVTEKKEKKRRVAYYMTVMIFPVHYLCGSWFINLSDALFVWGRDIMVGCSLMVQWVVGSIHHGRPIELFLISASAPRLLLQKPWYVLSYLWDGAYKVTLAANWKE